MSHFREPTLSAWEEVLAACSHMFKGEPRSCDVSRELWMSYRSECSRKLSFYLTEINQHLPFVSCLWSLVFHITFTSSVDCLSFVCILLPWISSFPFAWCEREAKNPITQQEGLLNNAIKMLSFI